MTREEAIEKLELLRQRVDEDTYRALIMAIKALEQQPCDDAISREAAIKAECDVCAVGGGYDKCQYFMQGCNEIECIRALPPVQPSCDKCAMNGSGSKYCDNCQPSRKGHWIYSTDRWKCSECGRTVLWKEEYCPSCGARMVEPQESEEQTE